MKVKRKRLSKAKRKRFSKAKRKRFSKTQLRMMQNHLDNEVNYFINAVTLKQARAFIIELLDDLKLKLMVIDDGEVE